MGRSSCSGVSKSAANKKYLMVRCGMAARSLEAFNFKLQKIGATAAIAYLNEGVAHRFTGAYRIRDEWLCNVLLHDKTGGVSSEHLALAEMTDSFCHLSLRNSHSEPRHLACGTSPNENVSFAPLFYHAVPLQGRNGDLWGTLCHFDLVPICISDDEFDLLNRAARHLATYFLVADNPSKRLIFKA